MRSKAVKYFKDDFLRSDKFNKSRDLINAILKDEEKYTKEEVEQKIKTYFEGVI